MGEFENEIRALRDRTESNRRQFLRAEWQTCWTAIDRARLELSLGNVDEAEREFAMATRGREVMEKFLSEAPDPLPEIEQKLAELRAGLSSLRSDLDAHRGPAPA